MQIEISTECPFVFERSRTMTEITTIWIIEDDDDMLNCLNLFLNECDDLRCTQAFSNCENRVGGSGTGNRLHRFF